MTREEAIAYYKKNAIRIKGIMAEEDEALKDRFFQTLEATEMAIKALEQEPCEDAISREAVIKAITNTSGIRGDTLNALYDLPPVNRNQRRGIGQRQAFIIKEPMNA